MYRAAHSSMGMPLPPIRQLLQNGNTEMDQRHRGGGNTGNGTQQQTLTYLCEEREVPERGMVEAKVPGGTILLVRQGEELFGLSAICPNCKSPLVHGVLCKTRIRCPTHGSAFNLRTGLLEDGVGLDSLWTFKIHPVGSSLFGHIPSGKLLTGGRPGADSLPRLISSSAYADPIVVVGGGIAGVTCAESLRQLGYSGPLVLVSRERHLPYDRKSLSKRLWTDGERENERSLRSREFLEHQLGISLWLGHTARAIYPDRHSLLVENANGNEAAKMLEYSNLVLALGATNRRLQGVQAEEQLEGLIYLRSLEDARGLAEEVRNRHVAIVGSGFLGFELASLVSPLARSVSVFGKATNPLTLLGSVVGNQIRKFIHDQGVNVRQESSLRSITGFDRVQQLTFKDGLTAVADTLIVAIGIMPCTSVLLGSGICTNPEGYVLVDQRMLTNQPDIYACGDCVNFPLQMPLTGPPKRVNLPHWQIAQYQARVVAYSILGIDYVPPLVPFIWTRLFDCHLTFSGDPTAEPDGRIVRGNLETDDFVVYLLRADTVVGVASCGPANVAVQFIEIFRRGQKVGRAEVEQNRGNDWRKWINF